MLKVSLVQNRIWYSILIKGTYQQLVRITDVSNQMLNTNLTRSRLKSVQASINISQNFAKVCLLPRTEWWSRRSVLVLSTSGWFSPHRRCPEWTPEEQPQALWEIWTQAHPSKLVARVTFYSWFKSPKIRSKDTHYMHVCQVKALSIKVDWEQLLFFTRIYDALKTINTRVFQGLTVHKWPWAKVKHILIGTGEIIWSHCHLKHTQW